MVLDTQWSPSYANIYRVTGMQFFAIIFSHHTSFLRTCITTILCCGTLRSGRKEFPACLYEKEAIKRMKRGDVLWRMKGPVVALTWIISHRL